MQRVATGVVEAFTQALSRLEVTWTRTPPGGLGAALREAVAPPAVAPASLFERFGIEEEAVFEEAGITLQPTVAQLQAARTGVTEACLGVADYGSLLLRNAPDGAEPVSLFPERHVAVLRAADIVPDLPAAFGWLGRALREAKSSFVIATGPSATADMGALVRGAHGPKTVHVIIVEE